MSTASPHFGVDLAWGERARTGIAEVTDDGRLVRCISVRTDDEITDVIAPLLGTASVVAFDAPLIVSNPTGQRACERDLARHFASFHAGPHPTNTNRPHMHPLPRAQRLARTLGLLLDPADRARDRGPLAIEVYPHPAMVSWFDLKRILPYKARTGRSLADRQHAFAELLAHMNRHLAVPMGLGEHADWDRLTQAVTGSQRQVDLDRAEDELDAICCARLAWLWAREPQTLTVFGDADGFIITPPPPRAAPMRGSGVRSASTVT